MKKKERKESSALCHTANIISKAHPFCAAVTCIPPKSSSSSRLRLRLPIIEKKNEQSQNGNTKSVAYNLQTWTLSPVESEIAGIQTNKL